MATKLLSVKECKEIYGLSRITLINYEKKGLIKPSVALVFSCIEEVNPFKGLGRNSETKRDSYFFWPGDN